MNDIDRASLISAKIREIESMLYEWVISNPGILLPGESFRLILDRSSRIGFGALQKFDWSDVSISFLNVRHHALKYLKRIKVETVRQLLKTPYNELLKSRNFGKQSLIEIVEALQAKGIDTTKWLDQTVLQDMKQSDRIGPQRLSVRKAVVRALSKKDWKIIFGQVEWEEYLLVSLKKLEESGNEPMLAGRILRGASYAASPMSSLYAINHKFYVAGLPYRLKPTVIPQTKHLLVERKLQVCVIPD